MTLDALIYYYLCCLRKIYKNVVKFEKKLKLKLKLGFFIIIFIEIYRENLFFVFVFLLCFNYVTKSTY